MAARHHEHLAALEHFRRHLSGGCEDLDTARRVLARFRLAFLRSHQRPIALLLSEGISSIDHMLVAVGAAIRALQSSVRPSPQFAAA